MLKARYGRPQRAPQFYPSHADPMEIKDYIKTAQKCTSSRNSLPQRLTSLYSCLPSSFLSSLPSLIKRLCSSKFNSEHTLYFFIFLNFLYQTLPTMKYSLAKIMHFDRLSGKQWFLKYNLLPFKVAHRVCSLQRMG